MIEEILSKNDGRPVSIADPEEARRMLFLLSQIAARVFTPKKPIRYPQKLELI